MPESIYPRHIAFIPDGNRRWAKKHDKDLKESYVLGIKVIENIIQYALKKGINYLSFFLYSAENKKRDPDWNKLFLDLLFLYLQPKCLEAIEKGIKVYFIGHKFNNMPKVSEMLNFIENQEPKNHKGNIIFALDYSGRQEIIDIVNSLLKQNITEINEEMFEQNMRLHCIPQPDLLVRTSGEKRISNFMLWQCAYTELYFTDCFWPDFNEEEFNKALYDFKKRQRRYGT